MVSYIELIGISIFVFIFMMSLICSELYALRKEVKLYRENKEEKNRKT